MKRVYLSDHAKIRMHERGITLEYIRQAIEAKNHLKRLKLNTGKIGVDAYLRGRILRVIYMEFKLKYVVVTAYWADQ